MRSNGDEAEDGRKCLQAKPGAEVGDTSQKSAVIGLEWYVECLGYQSAASVIVYEDMRSRDHVTSGTT